MAKKTTREQIYQAQMEALGIYDPAFDPEIKQLAELDRRRTRVRKAWSETAPAGGKPSFLDPHYQVLQQIERDILTHREALGLTPKALRRLKGAYYETVRVGELAADPEPAKVTMLDLVREKYAL